MLAPMRLAPCVPHWIMIQREAEMHIDNQFVHCSAFLGMRTTDDRFFVEGTGFFLRVDQDGLIFPYLVSAKHVVRDYFYKRPNRPLLVRVQRNPGLAPKLFDTMPNDWIDHPDPKVDISAYEVPWMKWDMDNDLNVIALMVPESTQLEQALTNFGFGLGSEVFIPSAYIMVPGEKQNLPVVRFGRISAMPSEPLWLASETRPAFLVETRSLAGMSGAPVLFHTDPYYMGRRRPSAHQVGNIRIDPAWLIGIVLGTYPGHAQSDWTEEIVGPDERFNSGISIVLPLAQIIETVNQQTLVDARQTSIAARQTTLLR